MQHPGVFCRLLKTLFPVVLIGLLIPSPAGSAEYTQQIQFTANGQPLTLLLRPSEVTNNLTVRDRDGQILASPVQTYIGRIKGDKNSWARLTIGGNAVDGIISRYGKRFRLQQTGNQPARIKPLAGNHDHRVTLTTNHAVTLNQPVPRVTRVAKIAIAVDSKYNDRHNGRGLEYALGLINSVDGIFREEFGLALQVVSALNVTERRTDPFMYGSVSIETMLRAFRAFRMTSPLFATDVSLVHLFTGNQPTDRPVGLAWIDTACRTDGYDVGLSTPYKHDILLAAHELAHNLGALHDSDTSCATHTDKVMWPYISSATSQQFSSCTVATVRRTLAASCHAMVPDLELASGDTIHSGTNARVAALDPTAISTTPAAAQPAPQLAIDLPVLSNAYSNHGFKR